MRRVAVAVVCALLAWSGIAGAAAHAELESMQPAAGSAVRTAPQAVTLTFGEQMRAMGSTVVVIDPNGHEVQAGAPSVSGVTVTVQLLPLTTPGTYHVNFRVLSADGHVVTQSERFTFAPGAAPTGEATSVPETSPIDKASPTAGYWITGLLLALAALVLAGVWRVRRD